MEYSGEDYKKVLTSLIQKQMLILGPNIALDRARAVAGLTVKNDGVVLDMDGDPQMVFKGVVSQYEALSGQVTKMVLASVIEKYPGMVVG